VCVCVCVWCVCSSGVRSRLPAQLTRTTSVQPALKDISVVAPGACDACATRETHVITVTVPTHSIIHKGGFCPHGWRRIDPPYGPYLVLPAAHGQCVNPVRSCREGDRSSLTGPRLEEDRHVVCLHV
jgi:hypothetical protein